MEIVRTIFANSGHNQNKCIDELMKKPKVLSVRFVQPSKCGKVNHFETHLRIPDEWLDKYPILQNQKIHMSQLFIIDAKEAPLEIKRTEFMELAGAYFAQRRYLLNDELDDIAERYQLKYGESIIVNNLGEYFLLAPQKEQIEHIKFDYHNSYIRLHGYKVDKRYRVSHKIVPIAGAVLNCKMKSSLETDYNFECLWTNFRVIKDLNTCKENKELDY